MFSSRVFQIDNLSRAAACFGRCLCLVWLFASGCSPKPTADADRRMSSSTSGTIGDNRNQAPHESQVLFHSVASTLGVDFVPTNGEEAEHYSILETLGVGVAWLDVQNDGKADIFIPGGGSFGDGPSVRGRSGELYIFDGQSFAGAAEKACLADDSLYSHAAVVADYDHDGFSDLLITGYGGIQLFRNCGDGTFLNATAVARLAPASKSASPLKESLLTDAWSTGAAWGDLNQDGHLDLYVTNYLDWSFQNHPTCFMAARSVCSPIRFAGLADALMLSDGAGGFEAADLPGPADGKGLASLISDLDLDGDLDIYVANDTTPNFLFENLGGGELREVGIESGTAFGESAESDGSMGIDVADYNGDGLMDLWVANFEGQSFALYENQGGLVFRHVSSMRGITSVGGEYVGFGTAFLDLDFDGDEDIVTANGHVTPVSGNAPFRQKPLLFENLGGQRFVNIASQAGEYFSQPHMGRGLAFGDLDGDADLDLVIAHTNEPVEILRNDTPNLGSWLRIGLIGRSSPRTPIGAIVRVQDAVGMTRVKVWNSGTSYLSTSEPFLTFGLGSKPDLPLQLDVRWPSGIEQIRVLDSQDINQVIMLLEPDPKVEAGQSALGR